MRDIRIEEISSNGIGIFYEFPRDGSQQIGWIPKKNITEVDLMRNTYSNLMIETYISSIKMLEFTSFKKVSIILEINCTQ